jgi:hypothetical protein
MSLEEEEREKEKEKEKDKDKDKEKNAISGGGAGGDSTEDPIASGTIDHELSSSSTHVDPEKQRKEEEEQQRKEREEKANGKGLVIPDKTPRTTEAQGHVANPSTGALPSTGEGEHAAITLEGSISSDSGTNPPKGEPKGDLIEDPMKTTPPAAITSSATISSDSGTLTSTGNPEKKEELEAEEQRKKEKALQRKRAREERDAKEEEWQEWSATEASDFFSKYLGCKPSTELFAQNNLTGQALARCSSTKLETLGLPAGDAMVIAGMMASMFFFCILFQFLFINGSRSPWYLALKKKFPDDEDSVILLLSQGKKSPFFILLFIRSRFISLTQLLSFTLLYLSR